jgi:hypothetical protein
MVSRTTRRFWRLFSNLPFDTQRDAKRAYRLFQSNPAHPGLQFKKLEAEDNIYSVRIGLEYRALAVMQKDQWGASEPQVAIRGRLTSLHGRRYHRPQ